MTADNTLNIIVTGERDDLSSQAPGSLENGKKLQWITLPVLRFERLPVDPSLLDRLVNKPVDWIVFTSPRAVEFWSQTLLEAGVDFPLETQVACIGEHTAEIAGRDGFNADFYPTEPGTEKFLEEFEDLISNNPVKPSLFIPTAEAGRTTIREKLVEKGCEVIQIALYRTLPREDLKTLLTAQQLQQAHGIVFTSPSSYEAFRRCFQLPPHVRVAALGQWTARHLQENGIASPWVLPEGDFSRIGEMFLR